jgi:hypothetical protein
MKRSHLSVLALLAGMFIFSPASAQQMIPKRCYFRFSGAAGDKLIMTLNLVKINDSLYGDYQLHDPAGNDLYDYDDVAARGSTPMLGGKLAADGSFALRSPFGNASPKFSGQFVNAQKIKGVWQMRESKTAIELTESYPAGSVQFNVSSLKTAIPLAKKKGSPSGKMEMTVLTPAESTNPLISDSLRMMILEKFTGSKVSTGSPDTALRNMKQAFSENYISSNEDLYKSPEAGPSLNWESLEHMHILFNEKQFLSYYIIRYVFTGGAHGLEMYDFSNVNLFNGKPIELKDIFIPGYEPALSDILTKKFRDISGLKPGQALKDAGFFTDTVKPVDNFYLTANGIGFFYNHYEIAPYANGPSNCFLDFGELKPLLNPSSVIRPLIRR